MAGATFPVGVHSNFRAGLMSCKAVCTVLWENYCGMCWGCECHRADSLGSRISCRWIFEIADLVAASHSTMRTTARLLQYTARITLFTRGNCSLCDDAKSVLEGLSKKRSLDYREVDVMASDQEQWKLYQYDTPVVSTY